MASSHLAKGCWFESSSSCLALRPTLDQIMSSTWMIGKTPAPQVMSSNPMHYIVRLIMKYVCISYDRLAIAMATTTISISIITVQQQVIHTVVAIPTAYPNHLPVLRHTSTILPLPPHLCSLKDVHRPVQDISSLVQRLERREIRACHYHQHHVSVFLPGVPPTAC